MLIAFEGIDGAGKSEITKKLAERLNATLHKTPPENKRSEQDHINRTATDEEHYKYFVGACIDASEEIRRLLKSSVVVLDRYWMTTVVYHRVMGIPARFEDFKDIVMPDVTVYLTVTSEIQEKRFRIRGMSPGDKRMDGRQNLIRSEYEAILKIESAPIIRLDTSPYSSDESTALILDELKKLGL